MTYEAWRISFQDSEQAARAAYSEIERLQSRIEALEKAMSEPDYAPWMPKVKPRGGGEL